MRRVGREVVRRLHQFHRHHAGGFERRLSGILREREGACGRFPGWAWFFIITIWRPPRGPVPRYLDLGLYARNEGIAFTHSSNLVNALYAAVKRVDWAGRFSELAGVAAWLRPKLRELGFQLVGSDTETSPAVYTLALPEQFNSARVGAQLNEAGFLLSYNSEYLRGRNWIQICLMGEFEHAKLTPLLNHLNRICFRRPQVQSAPSSESAPAKKTVAD